MAAPESIVSWRGSLLKEGPLLPEVACCALSFEEYGELPSQLQSLADGGAFRLCFAGREEIGTSPISCPLCHSSNSRRSKRRSVRDYLFSVTGVLPWRCESCETRFHARALPLRAFFYAHCGICGNLELQRIAAARVPGVTAILGRILGLPALRCEPCRHKFFSVRPLRRDERSAATASSD
jgi:hypothetical protein